MDVKAITRRLDALQQEADKNKPCKMTVIFVNGDVINTDPIDVWAVVHDHMMQSDVVSITADLPEYASAAGIMTILCHPVANREVTDFE